MLNVLNQAQPVYLILALLVEGIWLVNMGMSYVVSYRLMGMKESLWHMVALSSAAINFLGIVTPSAGISSLALFISDGKNKGHSSARIAIACMFYILFDYFGLLITALVGLLVLVNRDQLGWPEFTAVAVLALVVIALAFLLYTSIQWPQGLKSIFIWIFKQLNRLTSFLHIKFRFNEERVIEFVDEIHAGTKVIQENYRKLILPVGLGLSNKLLLILLLYLLFSAFEIPVEVGVVVCGFAIGYIFTILSPTPSGIGVMEGVMTLSLTSLGLKLEEAAIVTLAFRAISFWIPFFVGMGTFQVLTRRHVNSPSSSNTV